MLSASMLSAAQALCDEKSSNLMRYDCAVAMHMQHGAARINHDAPPFTALHFSKARHAAAEVPILCYRVCRALCFSVVRCMTGGYPEVCGVFFLSRVEYERGVRGGARLLPHACAARTSPVVGPLLKISTRGWARTARPEGRVRAVSHAGNSGRAHQGPARCRYTSAVTQVPTVRVPRTVH